VSAKAKQGKFVPERISRPHGKHKKNNEKNEFLSWLLSLVIAVMIALALRFFVFDFVIVDGISMEPTLYSGEMVFVEKISYRFNEPEVGDILISKYDDKKKKYVKRVMGTEGDEVEIRDGKLFVNGKQIIEPYIKEEIVGDMPLQIVAEDSVFLMGDNRNNSYDSRVSSVGSVSMDKTRGKAVLLVWPFKRFGSIDE